MWSVVDTARPRAGSHPMEASSPRILPAFADRTHFYHAVSGQFPATARQCVKKNAELLSDEPRLKTYELHWIAVRYQCSVNIGVLCCKIKQMCLFC